MNKQNRTLFGLLALLLVVSMLLVGTGAGMGSGVALAQTQAVTQEPTLRPKLTSLKVGILHVGAITDAGYNEAHHDGIEAMKKNLPNVEVIEAENVPESADAERVMENMIQQGAKLIIPASFGYLDPALNVAAKHPDVVFEHPSGYKLAPNLGTYWGSTPEAFYLIGIAAGKTTKTNKLGFVSAFPAGFILGNISAFHLGARSVNPNVETRLVFTGGWVDHAKEATATNALIDQGVDVIGSIVDSPITVVQTAEKRGAYSVGYHFVGLGKFAPKGWISGVAFDWGPLYTRFAQQVMDGTWKSEAIMGDLTCDYMLLAPWGQAVSQDTADLVAKQKQAIIDGKLKIWQGPIKDNQGQIRVKEGEVMSGDQINTMDWIVEGMVGQIK